MPSVPQAGNRLTSDDVEMIYESIINRQANFPGEPMVMSMAWVLANIGNSFTEVTCVGPEKWAAYAQDVVRKPGKNPTCPSGHEVEKTSAPLRLFWLNADMEVSLVKLKPEDEEKLSESGA